MHSNYGSLRVLAHSLSRISAGAEVECDRFTTVDTLVNGRSKEVDGLTVVPRATHCSRRRWTDCGLYYFYMDDFDF